MKKHKNLKYENAIQGFFLTATSRLSPGLDQLYFFVKLLLVKQQRSFHCHQAFCFIILYCVMGGMADMEGVELNWNAKRSGSTRHSLMLHILMWLVLSTLPATAVDDKLLLCSKFVVFLAVELLESMCHFGWWKTVCPLWMEFPCLSQLLLWSHATRQRGHSSNDELTLYNILFIICVCSTGEVNILSLDENVY